MAESGSAHQAYPSLRLKTLTGRLQLLYPLLEDSYDSFAALYNDPATSAFLPPFRAYLSEPLDFNAVGKLLSSHKADPARLGFSTHLLSGARDDATRSAADPVEILPDPPASSPPASTFVGAFGFTRIATDADTGLKHGELGLLIVPSAQGKGIVSEGLLALLDLGFAPVKGGPKGGSFGLGLDRIDLSTSTRNAPLRYWIEEVLGIGPVADEALTAGQKTDREAWGEDRLVFYQLHKQAWLDEGKRERIAKRIRERRGRNAAEGGRSSSAPGPVGS